MPSSPDPVPDASASRLAEVVRNRFGELFGAIEPKVAAAPGRVNLIGEHTDYNDGFVLPMAIDRFVAVAFAPNRIPVVRAHSVDFKDSTEIALRRLSPPGGSSWFDYVAGVLWALGEERGELGGFDLVVAGNVPIGAGLASSAALEMATARAAAVAADLVWDPMSMARAAQRAENEYVGVSCGIMDQIAAGASKRGCALLLDCRSLQYSEVGMPRDSVAVVMDTGTRRALADGAYNERRRNCEAAVAALRAVEPSICALRDATPGVLDRSGPRLDPVLLRRARHVVGENARTLRMADALRAGDVERAGSLMNESHRSLREDYEVSSAELDRIVDLARRHPACWGARMTGAGFGGCAVALVRADRADAFTVEVETAYRKETNLPGVLYVCRPVDGARLI